MKLLDRRTMLRGLAGTLIALPFLDAMSRPARAATEPKRLVIMFSGCGRVKSTATYPYDAWTPAGTETDFDLTTSPTLSPLAPHQSSLLVLDGIDNVSMAGGPGVNHVRGIAALTGTPLLDGPFADGDYTFGFAGGPSVDQVIAQEIAKKVVTKFSSLELGVAVTGSDPLARMCYRGANDPLAPRNDPWQSIADLFGDLTSNDADKAALEALRKRRHSVLDGVDADLAALAKRLGSEDKLRVDAHLSAIRDLEKQIDVVSQVGAGCSKPEMGDPVDPLHPDNFPLIGKLQMDLLVMALACDLTRVASLQWAGAGGDNTVQATWVDPEIVHGHHSLTHIAPGDPQGPYRLGQLVAVNAWYAEQLSYLLTEMKAKASGDGTTLLDCSAVLWFNELDDGYLHTVKDLPFIVAGGAGGYFDTGRKLRFDGASHNDLLCSLCHAMDVPVAAFPEGSPHCDGPLDGLAV